MTWPLAVVCVAFLVLVAWVADRVARLHDQRQRDAHAHDAALDEVRKNLVSAFGQLQAAHNRIDEVAKTAADAAHKATQVREQLTNAVVARTLR